MADDPITPLSSTVGEHDIPGTTRRPRRAFLRRAALAGITVVYAAPLIESLDAVTAHAGGLSTTPQTGFLEVCKKIANGPLGSEKMFQFVINGAPPVTVTVLAGTSQACTPVKIVPAGTATISEVASPGVTITDVTAFAQGNLVDLGAHDTVTVAIAASANPADQTAVTFQNTVS